MPNQCRDIMTVNPTVCASTDSVARIAQIMRDENVGSVPIVADTERRGLLGILTDRDITIQVVAAGRDPQSTTAGEVMTTAPVTARPEDDVDRTLEKMARYQVRRIPVIDDENRVVGIIAQADIATRTEEPGKTASVVEQISQPTDR